MHLLTCMCFSCSGWASFYLFVPCTELRACRDIGDMSSWAPIEYTSVAANEPPMLMKCNEMITNSKPNPFKHNCKAHATPKQNQSVDRVLLLCTRVDLVLHYVALVSHFHELIDKFRRIWLGSIGIASDRSVSQSLFIPGSSIGQPLACLDLAWKHQIFVGQRSMSFVIQAILSSSLISTRKSMWIYVSWIYNVYDYYTCARERERESKAVLV